MYVYVRVPVCMCAHVCVCVYRLLFIPRPHSCTDTQYFHRPLQTAHLVYIVLVDLLGNVCSSALDPDCHHTLTCRSGGDIIARHNKLRDCFANLCSKACLSPQLEKGPGLDFSRPADVLVPNWSLSNPAAFNLKVIRPLNTDLVLEATRLLCRGW